MGKIPIREIFLLNYVNAENYNASLIWTIDHFPNACLILQVLYVQNMMDGDVSVLIPDKFGL